MAKTSMIEREKRREKLVKQHAAKRAKLREIISSPKSTPAPITGRPRGVYRKFGLARTKLRESTMRGDIPGLRKASW